MSVLWARVIIDGRQGTATPEGTDYRRVIRVRCSSKADDETTIGISGLIPAIFSQHPYNGLATCREIDIQQFKGLLWDVNLFYTTRPLSQADQEKHAQQNPLNRASRIRYSWSAAETLTVKDREGNAILTSAGVPFREAVARPDSRFVVLVSKNFAAPPAFMLTHANRLNAAPYSIGGLTFDEDTLLFVPDEVSEYRSEGGVDYVEASWQLQFKSSWQAELLDAGFVYLTGDGETPPEEREQRQILLATGDPPSDPVLLDGEGAILANPSPETAVYREFDIVHTADFGVIPNN